MALRSLSFASLLALTLVSCAENQTFSAKSAPESKPKFTVAISTTAKTIADLPVCENSLIHMNAYLTTRDTSVKCDGYRWRLVNPGGFDGRFEKRAPVRFYEWADKDAKKTWSAPLPDPVRAAIAERSCQNGFKLPTKDELLEASKSGLVDGIRAHGGRFFDVAWTSDFAQGGRIALPLKADAKAEPGAEAGVYCVSFSQNS